MNKKEWELVNRKTERWYELGFGDNDLFPGYGKLYNRSFEVWYVDVGFKEKKGTTHFEDLRPIFYEPKYPEYTSITNRKIDFEKREKTLGYEELFTGVDNVNKSRWYFGLKSFDPAYIETKSDDYKTNESNVITPQSNSINKKNSVKFGLGCLGVIIVSMVILIILSNIDEDEPEPELSKSEKRVQQIENCLSAWDGSHPELEQRIKSSLNDEDSYEHIETRYIDNDSTITLITRFSAKNAFGGTLKKEVVADINNDCQLIEITQWYN